MASDTFRPIRGALGMLCSGGSPGEPWASVPGPCCGSGFPAGGSGLRSAAFLAVRLGIAGSVAALAFAAVVRITWRGRRLRDISWLKGGLLVGLVTGLTFPLFLQMMNVLSGDGLIAWSLVLDDGPFVGLLAAIAAGGTLKLAQRTDAARGGARRSARGRLGACFREPRVP